MHSSDLREATLFLDSVLKKLHKGKNAYINEDFIYFLRWIYCNKITIFSLLSILEHWTSLLWNQIRKDPQLFYLINTRQEAAFMGPQRHTDMSKAESRARAGDLHRLFAVYGSKSCQFFFRRWREGRKSATAQLIGAKFLLKSLTTSQETKVCCVGEQIQTSQTYSLV